MSNINESNWPLYIQQKYALDKADFRDAGNVRHPVPADSSKIKASDAVKWVYEVLTTLDAKASALMRLNGISIAAAAFLLGLFGRSDPTILSTASPHAALIVTCAFLSSVSIFLCLLVVNVGWSFLGKVKNLNGEFDFSDEIRKLDATCTTRQKCYRVAWSFSCVAIIAFLLELGWQTWFVICRVFFS